MSQSWYIKCNGKTMGPIGSAKLKPLARMGKIAQKTPLRQGDDSNWEVASKVKGLFAGFGGRPNEHDSIATRT